MAKFDKVFSNTEIKPRDIHPKRITKWIHYTKLIPSANQYRELTDEEEIDALADLIETDGEVLEDLLVRKMDADQYEIIAGHKRREACRCLVEKRGKIQFEFLPCYVKDLNDVQAEFQVYSSNEQHPETPYEKMHKLERMKYLLEHYPDEFPEVERKGRMVERLAKQMGMKKTTVGEYLSISKNLGEKGMDAFKDGKIDKSAAVTLASMPEDEQEKVLEQGITKDKEMKEYVQWNLEPTEKEVQAIYKQLHVEAIDQPDRKEVAVLLQQKYRNAGGSGVHIDYHGTATHIIVNDLSSNRKKITWKRLGKLFDEYIPYAAKEEQKKECPQQIKSSDLQVGVDMIIPGQLGISNTDMELTEEKEIVPNFGTENAIQEKGIDAISSAKQVCIRLLGEEYAVVQSGKPYLILRRELQIGDVLLLQLFEDGRATGESMKVKVAWVDTKDTNNAISKGYSIVGIQMIGE